MKSDTSMILSIARLIKEQNSLMADKLPTQIDANSTAADLELFLQNEFGKNSSVYGSAQIEGCDTHIIGVIFDLDGVHFVASDDMFDDSDIERFLEDYQNTRTFQTLIDQHGNITVSEFREAFAGYLQWLQKKHIPARRMPIDLVYAFVGGVYGEFKYAEIWNGGDGKGINVEYDIEDETANW